MSKRLTPCPFCGNGDLRPTHLGPWWVECFNCLASGPPEPTKEKAMAAWNGRVLAGPLAVPEGNGDG